MVRRIASRGAAVVFITHRLREVSEIADRVTILRRGRVVFSDLVHERSNTEITTIMFGDGAQDEAAVGPPRAATGGEALRFESVSLKEGDVRTLDGVDLSVRAGEIVCVTGIREYGPKQLEAVCAGDASPTEGSIVLASRRYSELTPALLRRHGVGFVPNDRYGSAVSAPGRVWESLIVNRRRELHRRGFLCMPAVDAYSRRLLASAGVSAPIHGRVSHLSGGTVQRLIVAREIDYADTLLIISEPFWGLDLGGRNRIVAELDDLRRNGTAVLAFASDVEDVLRIADRAVVFYRGAVSAVIDRSEMSRGSVGAHMLGFGRSS